MSKLDEKACIENWRTLLNVFHKIEDDKQDNGAKEKYQKVIELAKTKELTPRQLSGIIERCNYRIHLIDKPETIPFSNMERQEKRLNLSTEQSNGKAK